MDMMKETEEIANMIPMVLLKVAGHVTNQIGE
jgi:hypothetical protein